MKKSYHVYYILFILFILLILISIILILYRNKNFNTIWQLKVPSKSQIAQDLYVLLLLNYKHNGTYVEIGCHEPEFINNTFILEKYFNWKGISLDNEPRYRDMWNRKRVNPIEITDALTYDYSILPSDDNFIVDYLSLDIDEKYVDVLKKIPFDKYKFRVITIEHDAYRFGDVHRNAEREFLTKYGYELLYDDIDNYEDWWVMPTLIDQNNHLYKILKSITKKENK